MAITTNWPTLTFSIPQADLTFVVGTLYELDTEVTFRQAINAIMASEEGIVFEDSIRHNTEVTVAGTTFARTIEVINNYNVTFTPDSQFSVRLAGSNNNIFDVENGILNQNQVQVIAQNSAGLIREPSTSIDPFTSSHAVHIDAVSGLDTNTGAANSPVKTVAAAKIIADANALREYSFKGSITLSADHDRWTFRGTSAGSNDTLNLANRSIDESFIEGCRISGDATESSIEAFLCEIDNPGNIYGLFRQCGLLNTFKVEATAAQTYVFHQCYSQVPGNTRPVLDFTSSAAAHQVQLRDYIGGISVRNMVAGDLSIDSSAGRIFLEATMTAGDIAIGGVGFLSDLSAGATVNKDSFVQGVDVDLTNVNTTIIRKIIQNRTHTDPATGIMTIFDDDDSTVLFTGNIYEDVLAATLYSLSSRRIDRRNRLT